MKIGINWAAGGPHPGIPGYGSLGNLAIAATVLVAILFIIRFLKGFFANIAVLLGIVLGMVISIGLHRVSFENIGLQPWFAMVKPFQFGWPTFQFGAVLTMCLVMIVVMIESLGMFLALAEITGKPVDQKQLSDGLRVDGLGTLIGGIFNTFPYTSFSQNVGLVGVTGVRSRYVCVMGGGILLTLGLIPKMAFIVASVPQYVLGGAGIVMFGMVAATGIRILGGVDFQKNRNNLYIVAISVGFGMIPLVAPAFFKMMPKSLEPLLGSGILLASIMAVVLNIFFNQLKRREEAGQESAVATKAVEA
jgi:NCS2 family nucleobase:cation symporter-2